MASGILKRGVVFGGDNLPHRRKPKINIPQETTYIIRLKTGDLPGAGTDANIYIQFYNRNGKTTGTIRCKDDSGEHFEKNQVDIFRIKAPCIGDISRLKIWHDNTGKHASWQCHGLQVDDECLKRRYHFPQKFWLSVRLEDCQISRELPCAGRSVLHNLYPKRKRTSESTSSARTMSPTLRNEPKQSSRRS